MRKVNQKDHFASKERFFFFFCFREVRLLSEVNVLELRIEFLDDSCTIKALWLKTVNVL